MSIFNKRKPKYSYKVGGGAFCFDFYIDEKDPKGNYLHITTPSGAFEQTVRNYAFGYLLAASQQGKMDELAAYGLMLYRVSEEVYQDLGFCQDIIKAINKRDKRLAKKAEKAASEITEYQDQADAAFMDEVAAYADATPKERKKMRQESKAAMREVLNEKEEENGE